MWNTNLLLETETFYRNTHYITDLIKHHFGEICCVTVPMIIQSCKMGYSPCS